MNICEYLCESVLDAFSNVSYIYSFQKPYELGSLVSIFYRCGEKSKDTRFLI